MLGILELHALFFSLSVLGIRVWNMTTLSRMSTVHQIRCTCTCTFLVTSKGMLIHMQLSYTCTYCLITVITHFPIYSHKSNSHLHERSRRFIFYTTPPKTTENPTQCLLRHLHVWKLQKAEPSTYIIYILCPSYLNSTTPPFTISLPMITYIHLAADISPTKPLLLGNGRQMYLHRRKSGRVHIETFASWLPSWNSRNWPSLKGLIQLPYGDKYLQVQFPVTAIFADMVKGR